MNEDNSILFPRLFTRAFCRDFPPIPGVNIVSIDRLDDSAECYVLIRNLVRYSNAPAINVNRLPLSFPISLILINLSKDSNLDEDLRRDSSRVIRTLLLNLKTLINSLSLTLASATE